MRITRFIAGIGVLAGIVAAKPARFAEVAHPLVGKWNVEYERGRQNMNGQVNIITGKAIVELTAKGDSLIGTFTPEAVTGRPAPEPTKIAGTGAGNRAILESVSTSRINLNGEESTVTLTTVWELKADGDALSGTATRSFPNQPMPPTPTPVKGMRVK